MAKAKSSAPQRPRISRYEMGARLWKIARDIEAVECTAVCLELALLEFTPGQERELAVCVECNIANELGRVSKDMASLVTAFSGEPYTPLLESVLLGTRVKPASDKLTRKGQ